MSIFSQLLIYLFQEYFSHFYLCHLSENVLVGVCRATYCYSSSSSLNMVVIENTVDRMQQPTVILVQYAQIIFSITTKSSR